METNALETMTHPLITVEHLNRKAIVYVRYSTDYSASPARQLYELQLAREYGWPEDLIELIDEDMGKSGSSIEHRAGYRRLLALIREGSIGAVFAASASRLSRQRSEFKKLRRLASAHGTLVCLDNRVIDPNQ